MNDTVFSDNVATLIHDLKTPVIAQEKALDLLLQNAFGELNKSQFEIIEQIKDSCNYLKNLVYSAMNIYLANDNLNLNPEYFNITEAINSILTKIKPIANEKNQKFIMDCDNIIVYADKFQIKRVITNLVSNAITYSYSNSLIEISLKQSENNIIFTVINYSNPIKNIDKVFDKFESTSNSGLGLFLVKQIIQLHKGSVFAKKDINYENKYSFGFVIPNI